jgi:hypothetical protein
VTTSSSVTSYTRVGAGAGSMTLNRWTHLLGVYDAGAGAARRWFE